MRNSTKILINTLPIDATTRVALLRAIRDHNKTYVQIAIRNLPAHIRAMILKEIQ